MKRGEGKVKEVEVEGKVKDEGKERGKRRVRGISPSHAMQFCELETSGPSFLPGPTNVQLQRSTTSRGD